MQIVGQRRSAATGRTITALILREMATSYGRSPGGYLWAVAEPAAAVALLSAIFAVAFSAPSIGVSFPLFYATGYLPFMMFNDVANKVAASIRFSKPLLAYPSVTFLDAILARHLLNSLTHFFVGLVVFAGIIILFDTRAEPEPMVIALAFAMAATLGLGIGTLNCYLMTAYPAWERAWQILTRPLFIVSGIFFVYDDLPRNAQEFIWFNPLMHVAGVMRRGFYGFYDGAYISVAYVLAVSAATFVPGLILLRRHHRVLLEN